MMWRGRQGKAGDGGRGGEGELAVKIKATIVFDIRILRTNFQPQKCLIFGHYTAMFLKSFSVREKREIG